MAIIRVTDETFARLDKLRTHPTEPIGRVVADLLEAVDEGRPAATPAFVGQKKRTSKQNDRPLPEKEYRKPIQDALERLGSKAATSQIRLELQTALGPRFTAADRKKHASGVPVWWNRANWAMQRLKDSGLICAQDGVWALQPAPAMRHRRRLP